MPRLNRIGMRIARWRRWASHIFLQPRSIHISHRPANPPEGMHVPR